VPLAAGNPAALSVTFHPSTRGAISSANFRNLRVGTNSFSIFIKFPLWAKEREGWIKKPFAKPNPSCFKET
jgi:hypothetical protein